MDRRDFLKAAALTGLAVSGAATLAPSKARADGGPFTGLFVISVNAGGGWDPTGHVDPKGHPGETTKNTADEMNHTYGTSQILTVAGHRYAPLFGVATNNAIALPNGSTLQNQNTPSTAVGATDFFQKWGPQMYAINGIDQLTNDHDAGSRNTWSGKLTEGYPAFSALYAGSVAGDKPMAYITGGGYEVTAGVVAATRGGSVDILRNITKPNVRDTNQNQLYQSQDTYDRVTRFQNERLAAAIEQRKLPRWRNALNTLFTVRSGNSELTKLNEVFDGKMPNSNQTLAESLNALNNQNELKQVRLGLAAYRAGIAAAVNVSFGGFDTHGNHDQMQTNAQRRLFSQLDYILSEVELQGIDRSKVLVIVGSDFGRTPGYNDGAGKDHWATTSMLFFGGGVKGGKTVGGTTDGDKSTAHRPRSVNPATLELLGKDDPAGIRITPQHITKALRKLTGIDQNQRVASEFILDSTVEALPLFT